MSDDDFLSDPNWLAAREKAREQKKRECEAVQVREVAQRLYETFQQVSRLHLSWEELPEYRHKAWIAVAETAHELYQPDPQVVITNPDIPRGQTIGGVPFQPGYYAVNGVGDFVRTAQELKILVDKAYAGFKVGATHPQLVWVPTQEELDRMRDEMASQRIEVEKGWNPIPTVPEPEMMTPDPPPVWSEELTDEQNAAVERDHLERLRQGRPDYRKLADELSSASAEGARSLPRPQFYKAEEGPFKEVIDEQRAREIAADNAKQVKRSIAALQDRLRLYRKMSGMDETTIEYQEKLDYLERQKVAYSITNVSAQPIGSVDEATLNEPYATFVDERLKGLHADAQAFATDPLDAIRERQRQAQKRAAALFAENETEREDPQTFAELEATYERMKTWVEERDSVNHPQHYLNDEARIWLDDPRYSTFELGGKHWRPVECIEQMRHIKDPRMAHAFVYVWRICFGGKDNDVEDAKKAAWFLNDFAEFPSTPESAEATE